ncbi:hypothetical protein Memar_1133 [Methanoculleus marisnigri JR1]|uniref:Uncharacterized protein n=1 Tax=Methanoculleus marisnigri (strain ATCC 35101 / DSM 1498 / JR1) TaxID=368407 RepID=A3CUL5_METMJ|nr:hypothetical protein Memar_1133 [Methanoculleus marisnigri JR1]
MVANHRVPKHLLDPLYLNHPIFWHLKRREIASLPDSSHPGAPTMIPATTASADSARGHPER